MKDEIIRFLRNISFDFVENDPKAEVWPECEGQGKDNESCPKHEDCGICRYEYMKRKDWLSKEASQQK